MRTKVAKSCGKHRYGDAIAAKLALAEIRHKDSPYRPRMERRAYECGTCGGWHLTSQADWRLTDRA